MRPQRGPQALTLSASRPESGGSPSDMVLESQHAGAEVELLGVAPLGLTWKVTLTLSAFASADDCSLVVNVADPVLTLTLKLALNQTTIGSLC